MKKCLLIAALLILLAVGTVTAQVGVTENLGIGFVIGQPTGITAKYWLGNRLALDGGVAWQFADPSTDDEGHFTIYLDGVSHLLEPFNLRAGRLPVFVGVGARLTLSADPLLGLRIPVGLSYLLPVTPLELFGEIVPGLLLLPDAEFNLDGGVGLRFYF